MRQPNQPSTSRRLLNLLGPFLGLLLVIGLFSLSPTVRPHFLTWGNFQIIFIQTVIVAIGTLGMTMIWWMNAYDYKIPVGGKPLFSPIFSFPVAYECTILLGAFGSLGGMLILNRLPRLYNPVFNSERFRQATHDRFFIVIEATDPKFSDTETRQLLEAAGSKHIEEVRD